MAGCRRGVQTERQWPLADCAGQPDWRAGRRHHGPNGQVNVTRTLRTVIGHISAAAPQAGAHLQASIRTGLECRYDPAPGGPSRWSL